MEALEEDKSHTLVSVISDDLPLPASKAYAIRHAYKEIIIVLVKPVLCFLSEAFFRPCSLFSGLIKMGSLGFDLEQTEQTQKKCKAQSC